LAHNFEEKIEESRTFGVNILKLLLVCGEVGIEE